ncbi:MAG: peptidylprolyl isomerase [Clostridia bacterium]|nr:peptidylprolyl isomerase [Clostridia bacterium]
MKKFISVILIITTLLLSATALASCKKEREIRDYYYAEMTVKNFGTVIIKLDRTAAPVTVDNFVALADDGFYDGLTFHRIIDDFMIQGGASDESSVNPIKGEFSSNGHENPLSHTRGTISMARTSEPDSATSQFFICNADSPHLDGDYAAFGYVVEGMDVIDDITEYGIRYTYGGIIYYEQYRPVIESIKIYYEMPEK